MEKDYKKELIKLVEKTEVNKGYHDYFKNKDLVNNYFEIGKLLIEAQGGEEHDTYGNKLIKTWSVELTEKFGKANEKEIYFDIKGKKYCILEDSLGWDNILIVKC